MANKELVRFLEEARKRGFGDEYLKKALMNEGWSVSEIEKAIAYLAPKYINKNQVVLSLSDELLETLEKRANKNMLTLSELIEDILRRSTLNLKGKKSIYDEKLDDRLVSVFSRKNTGRKKI